MKREILRWPDKRLRMRADPVDAVTDKVRATWDDMIETMDATPGYGLAAPQIGVMLRLAVVDVSPERGRAVRLANPEIVAEAGEARPGPEGSPCLPGVSASILRPVWVDVAFLDQNGARVQKRFEDLSAVSVLHQIDHLNGRMYFDRLSRTRREMLIRRSQRITG